MGCQNMSGKNNNSNSTTLKTSQFSANPSLNIKWDLIDLLEDPKLKLQR